MKEDEIPDGLIRLSNSNKWHEANNPIIAKFINSIQGRIRISNDIKTEMVDNSNKIFEMMKKEKGTYLKTLLSGEDQGHCTGIKKRIDPTIKYKLVQQMTKYKML